MQISVGSPVKHPVHYDKYELALVTSSGVSHGEHIERHFYDANQLDELERDMYLLDGYRKLGRADSEKRERLLTLVAKKYNGGEELDPDSWEAL